jgi:hypothetical protein
VEGAAVNYFNALPHNNMVLGKIYGHKREKRNRTPDRTSNEELQNLCPGRILLR